ncbi:MAG: PAS domain S-box protein [Deltaproteobacteria bacterium]|nr:PAS domain S-box protein [Deltaproteobacteria bacterium]
MDSAWDQQRSLEERVRVLSAAMRPLDETSDDAPQVVEALARRAAELAQGLGFVLLLADDGQTLTTAAAFHADAGVLEHARQALSSATRLSNHPMSRRVVETGEPGFVPKLTLAGLHPDTAPAWLDLVQQVELHSLLMVAMRTRGRSIGVLAVARVGRDSAALTSLDLEVAQYLASQAALAIGNATLLEEARRETAERRRLAERFRILSDSAHEFAASTDDLQHLLDVVARRLGELVGDLCSIRATTEDGVWLDTRGGSYHRDPDLHAAARDVMHWRRQRVGEGVSGRAAATGLPVLIKTIDPAEFAASSEAPYREFLLRLAPTSAMLIPLVCRGEVVGVASFLRSAPKRPYSDDDFQFARSIADHAALAIGNARAYAAEHRARDAAEHATRAMHEARSRFARLSESGILGIVVGTLDGRVVEVNDAMLAMVGYDRDEILSARVAWKELTPPEWRDVDAGAIAQLEATGIGPLREKEYVRKDGRRLPVLIGSALVVGDAGEVISFVLDLSERNAAHDIIEQLREQRAADARFRALLEAAPDAMVIVGIDGSIVLVNRQAEAMFGYSRAELVGQPIEMLVPEHERDRHVGHRGSYFRAPAVRAMGAGLELSGRRKDGSLLSIEVSLSPLETSDGRLVSAAIRDTTQRVIAEQHRARLAAIVDASGDAIIGKTLAGVITSWNPGAQQLFGYTADEIVGRSITALIPPGREAEESMILEHLAVGAVERFDTVRRRKDGRDLDVAVTISPVRDAIGRIVGIAKVVRDITDRRRTELALAAAKDAAEAANRELEAFSYAVAHDLRAPLRGMNGFAQVLLDTYRDRFDAEGQDWLQEIVTNAHKMGALIDALLALSRVTRAEVRRESVDVSAIARASVAALQAADPERTVEVIVQDGLRADLDPVLARSLVDNLVGNAWKYTRKVAAARIEIGARAHDGATTLFVRDNGAGFDMAFAGKLFAPFQRLHSGTEFPGTGIGLATAKRIVLRHGGRIWAEGAVDAGATFYVTIPARRTGAT